MAECRKAFGGSSSDSGIDGGKGKLKGEREHRDWKGHLTIF